MTDGGGTIGVGMLGYAFMGKAHAHAYRTLSYMTWPPPLRPRLVAVAGREASFHTSITPHRPLSGGSPAPGRPG